MNIFILDNDINKSIQYMPDKHIVKMPLETTQLLCNTYYLLNQEKDKEEIYKPSNLKHPCSLWVIESLDNWVWLRDYAIKLGEEYTYRYGKTHKSVELAKKLIVPDMKSKGITPFVKCVADELKDLEVVEAYRQYFIKYKQHLKEYRKREIPDWWVD